ncbi:MAG: amidohydrolase family protein [Deltaproteobacteria bacterium]|nr:amidohydrolase family protein [Deltaproteobacteria bacterium]
MPDRVIIRGGLVVDGSGDEPFEADVAVSAGRIAEIGSELKGDQVIDASGALVAPGFIDLHTHYDPQVLWDPWLSPSSTLGVTSVVAGNCGLSVAPCPPELRGALVRMLDAIEDMRVETLEAGISWNFETYPEYLAAIRERGIAINFGGFIGHTAVRLWVMGAEAYERTASSEEIAAMRSVVREAVDAGALGFSTDRGPYHKADGGRPVPSTVASVEEVEALCMAVAEAGRGIIHVSPGETFDWLYELQPRLGCPVTWSAILTYPEDTASRAHWSDKLEQHRRGVAAGADVHPQVTCRPITFQFTLADPAPFFVLPAFAELGTADYAGRARIYADPAWRARARQELDSGRHLNPRWDSFDVAESRQTELVGRAVAEVAREREEHPLDTLVSIGLADDLETRFRVTFANDDVDGVSELLKAPGCVLGLSDAGAHVGQMCEALMPLDYLASWVRDRSLASPAEGIRKLTGELADLVRLNGRGYLRPGYAADIVVLDWETLDPGPTRRVWDLPADGNRLIADQPRGLRHVLVNGEPIRLDGKQQEPDSLPGQLLDNA